MKNTIKILGREHEIFWSAQAMHDVSEKCGKLSKLAEWIKGEDEDTAEMYMRFTEVVEIVVNAAITRDNFAIKNGFTQGEEKEPFKAGDLSMILSRVELDKMCSVIYNALSRDTDYEIPDGVQIEQKEVDETLEEIQENRRKKEESGE